eukprot:1419527-Rhodomonas_salina.2
MALSTSRSSEDSMLATCLLRRTLRLYRAICSTAVQLVSTGQRRVMPHAIDFRRWLRLHQTSYDAGVARYRMCLCQRSKSS